MPSVPVRVFDTVGIHDDGWCEPSASFRIEPGADVSLCQLDFWLKPEAGRTTTSIAVKVGSAEPVECVLPYGVQVSTQIACDCRTNDVVTISLLCDNSVSEKGTDQRDLSYKLCGMRFSAVATEAGPTWLSPPTLQQASEKLSASRRIVLDGLFEREVRGRIWVTRSLGSAAPRVFDGTRQVGVARVQSGPPPPPAEQGKEPGIERTFVYTLPFELYDGEVHTLWVDYGGERKRVVFAGDPTLLLPKRLRTRMRSEPTARQPAGKNNAPDYLALIRELQAQTQALQSILADRLPSASAFGSGAAVERYGDQFRQALRKTTVGRDFIWFGVIDWRYRFQRPQHLAAQLADMGHRVLYVAITFEPADTGERFRVISSPHPGVFEIQLRIGGVIPQNIYSGFDERQVAELRKSVDEMLLMLNVEAPIAVVQYPSWYPIAMAIPGVLVVHDCLDFVGGFSNVPKAMMDLEESLIADADVVVTASQPLADRVKEERPCVLIRNAADVEFFATAEKNGAVHGASGRPVIGYFGAIAEWFEIGWIESCAKTRPDWDFVLIGAQTGCDVERVAALPNVRLVGEKPYQELPSLLATFDVAVIPFKINRLTECTNPVKLYEFMAAGKPVVASPLPEVLLNTDMAYIATDPTSFERQIARALLEDSPQLRKARRDWAIEHTWESRARRFADIVSAATPLVSVIVLAYNNWRFTEDCLRSIFTLSDYPNLEVIVVDNASTDETRAKLERLRERYPSLRVILNDKNLGFPAGNNVGLRAAKGEYVILLNNDTYVTQGWVRDLIRPLQLDPKVGLAGPLTNNIGNEQKVAIVYDSMDEMLASSRAFTRERLRKRLRVENLAFFCVAMRRDVLDRVGLLDEAYGLGFFEDDDYCKRVLEAGYQIVVADDVFVHHHLSASFDKLGHNEKQEQMDRSRAIYSERWGPWKPHVYRDAPGFG